MRKTTRSSRQREKERQREGRRIREMLKRGDVRECVKRGEGDPWKRVRVGGCAQRQTKNIKSKQAEQYTRKRAEIVKRGAD